MKILYLFNRVRTGLEAKITSGQDHDGHFFGMYRLKKLGFTSEFIELEQFLPRKITKFLRAHILNVHYAHLPFFFILRRYDVVFTSTAWGSLFLLAVLKTYFGVKRPRWVVFDFGIKGMIGAGTTRKQKIFKYIFGKADGIITISKGEESVMKEMFPHIASTVLFIPLGVDTNFFTPHAEEKDFILSPGKDSGRDIKTLALASEGIISTVKITAWPGNIVKAGNLSSHVVACDFSPTELREQYAQAKMVVLPLNTKGGLNDAMGCSTLVEAMAMRKPIIASATETMASYITHGENGLLVPEGDVEALRNAIIKLNGDVELRRRLGSAAREFAVTKCSADIFASSLAKYFTENFQKNSK